MPLKFEEKKKKHLLNVPYLLQPENAIGNLAKRMSGAEPIACIKILDRGGTFEICDMNKIGEWLYDPIKEERFMVQHKSVDLGLKRTEGGRPEYLKAYLIDGTAATTVELTHPEDVVKGVWLGNERVAEIKVPDSIKGYTLRGTTIEFVPDAVMEKFRANPQFWAAWADNHDAADTYAPPNNYAIIILAYIVGVISGGLVLGFIALMIGLIGGHL